MKQEWRIRYQESTELIGKNSVNVLTGFNANIDFLYKLENLEISLEDVDEDLVNPVENMSDLKSTLKYCVENGENEEVNGKDFHDLMPELGRKRMGGQAGIIANFLSGFNNYVMFHTPLLSKELANMINSQVVSPVMEGKILLKRVKECVTTDRTKKNTIIEFSGEKTGRLIVSDNLKGFGPYFRTGVEDNFEVLEEEIDRMILSGYQNIDGNLESKLQKAKKQLSSIESDKHLEYVAMEDQKSEKVFETVLPEFDSIGMDETEAKQIAEFSEVDLEGENLGSTEALKLSKELIREKGLSRVHVHTYRYHVCVSSKDYEIRPEKMSKAILFGEACAIQMADQGEIPDQEDMKRFDLENKHIHRGEPLEKLSHELGEDDFASEGVYEDDEFKVVAAPTLIHEEPERLVGMGDIISSGAFTAELK